MKWQTALLLPARFLLQLLLVSALAACSSSYYSALEKFGIEKRDILVDRIDDESVGL